MGNKHSKMTVSTKGTNQERFKVSKNTIQKGSLLRRARCQDYDGKINYVPLHEFYHPKKNLNRY